LYRLTLNRLRHKAYDAQVPYELPIPYEVYEDCLRREEVGAATERSLLLSRDEQSRVQVQYTLDGCSYLLLTVEPDSVCVLHRVEDFRFASHYRLLCGFFSSAYKDLTEWGVKAYFEFYNGMRIDADGNGLDMPQLWGEQTSLAQLARAVRDVVGAQLASYWLQGVGELRFLATVLASQQGGTPRLQLLNLYSWPDRRLANVLVGNRLLRERLHRCLSEHGVWEALQRGPSRRLALRLELDGSSKHEMLALFERTLS
jgi:hypothetical protein